MLTDVCGLVVFGFGLAVSPVLLGCLMVGKGVEGIVQSLIDNRVASQSVRVVLE